MPKPHTFPILYNEALQIHISKLKEWNYLNLEQLKSGTITWSSSGEKIADISIKINTLSEQSYIELDYKYGGDPRNYKVGLVCMPSNLGKGVIWYFHCPVTNKRCRKLYSIGGYFLHREAFTGCMYDSQIQSKKYRELDKTLGAYFKTDELYEQLYKKHFKKYYKGKPTKRYLRLIEKINNGERFTANDIEHLLMFG